MKTLGMAIRIKAVKHHYNMQPICKMGCFKYVIYQSSAEDHGCKPVGIYLPTQLKSVTIERAMPDMKG